MSRSGELYDRDFVRWTEQQAAALRRAKDSNLPLDWENLAEEIESLGKSQRSELRSQIRRIIRHLLKLEASPPAEPRRGWYETVNDARVEIEDLLQDSPSLRRDVDQMIIQQTPTAARLHARDLTGHGEPTGGVEAKLDRGEFTAEQVLGDWFPEIPRPTER